MILPAPGNVQVRLGIAFTLEPEAFQQPGAAFIAGNVVGHDPVQVLGLEHIGDGRLQRFLHQPLALMRLVDVITQITRLKRTANDPAEIAGADHLRAVRGQQRHMHRQPGFEGTGLNFKASADLFSGKVIGGANR